MDCRASGVPAECKMNQGRMALSRFAPLSTLERSLLRLPVQQAICLCPPRQDVTQIKRKVFPLSFRPVYLLMHARQMPSLEPSSHKQQRECA